MSYTGYAPPPVPKQGSIPPLPRASRGRVFRRGIQRAARGVGATLRYIFSERWLLTLLFILLVPFTGWLMYERMFAGQAATSAGGQAVVTKLPEPMIVGQYFKAVQQADADAVWNTLSPTLRARRIASSEDKTILTQILRFEQQSGMTYSAYHYVGSYQNPSNPARSIYFYVGDISNGKQSQSRPFLFSVDQQGMITELQDPVYNALRDQLLGSSGGP